MAIGASSRDRLLEKSREYRESYREEKKESEEAPWYRPDRKLVSGIKASADRIYSRSFKRQAKQANDAE